MENEDTKAKLAEQLELLRYNKAAIVADLDVNQVIPFLLEQLILSHDDKQRIEHEVTLKDKSIMLLKILEAKAIAKPDGNVIPIFIESLQKHYDWLYTSLTETDVPDSRKPPVAGTPSGDEDDNVFESPKHTRVRTMLEAGGVNCPLVAVERKQLVETVRTELKHLRRSHFLVLQGMAGCGKSILAQQAINSASLIKNVFPDGVYMMAIGKEGSDTKDGLMSKIRILCDKLEETRSPVSLEHGGEMLRAAFMKRPKALLVLDGVWRAEVIRSFDVGCATMVTTRDISVMDVVQSRMKYLRIDSGFSEAESMELFRKTLNFEQVEDVPTAAKSIHYTSKGSPMVVSLISSLIQDHPDEIRDEGRWSYYLDALSKRRYSKIRRNRDYEHESIYDAISLSVEALDEKKRSYYYDFALFQDDVSIPCPVLEVLWGVERYEVGDIMKHFVKKSLICEEVHPARNWHVYSIHSLQLDYLKHHLQCNSKEDDIGSSEQALHQRLISQYLTKCEYNFDKLPDDDYIHFYIGYHLHKSRQFALFPQIYLNLLFIGEKLRLCGPADLLTDLRKYRDFILGGSEQHMKILEEIQGFAELVGYVKYGQEDVDIVQLALQNPNFEGLQQMAREIAFSEPSRLYFEWIGADTQQWKNPESSVVCSGGVRCVKFVGPEGHYFLAGLNEGTIELCDMRSCAVIWRFSGHTDTVTCLTTFECPTGSNYSNENGETYKLIFLSTSEDSTCKIWTSLNSIIQNDLRSSTRYSRQSSGNDSPSPKIRNSIWTFEKIEDQSFFTFEFHTAGVSCAQFSPTGTEVVSASSNEILVWDVSNGQILYKNSPSTVLLPSPILPIAGAGSISPFVSCHFGPMSSSSGIPYILLGTGNQLCLFPLLQSSVTASVQAANMNIVSVLYFAADWICVVSENDIGLWKVETGESLGAPRRKSLSPRRSFPGMDSAGARTEVDASRAAAWRGQRSTCGPFLLPPTTLERFTNGSDEVRTSSIRNSASTYAFQPLSASIDNGEHFVKIVREQFIPKKTQTQGLYRCAAITQDHKDLLLACGTSNMKICLFNLLTKEFLGEFNTHTGLLRCLDFSKVDEWTLLSGSEDQTVMVWDVEKDITGQKPAQKRQEFDAVFIESRNLPGVTDSGHFLSVFSTDSDTIQIYKDATLVQETSKLRSEIKVVCLSTTGSNVVVGTAGGMIYRIHEESKVITKHEVSNTLNGCSKSIDLVADLESEVRVLQFNSTDEFLVGISDYGAVQILKNFVLHFQIKLPRRNVVGVHFPFHRQVAFVCEHKRGPVVIFDLEGKAELKGCDDPDLGHASSSALKLDSSCLAIGTRDDGICFCSLRLGVGVLRPTFHSSAHKSAITALAFSPDGVKLAVGFKNGLITIWESGGTGGIYAEVQNLVLHKAPVRQLVFSPIEIGDRRWLVSCGDRLGVWSLGKPAEQIPKSSFMAERRRRRSGDSASSRPSSRMSLELPSGMKIGKQGKRELLNSIYFRGNFASKVVSDSTFSQFVTVDNTGIFYLLRIMKQNAEIET